MRLEEVDATESGGEVRRQVQDPLPRCPVHPSESYALEDRER
jgi:hypothetical protein